jgi:hypothetical protein
VARKILVVFALWLVPALGRADQRSGGVEISILSGESFLDVKGVSRESRPCFVCATPAASFPAVFPPLNFEKRVSVDRSVLFGLRVGYYVSPRVEVEGGVAIGPSHTLGIQELVICPAGLACPFLYIRPTSQKVTAYAYDAAGVFHLTRGRVRPFLSLGLGGISYDGSGRHTNFAWTGGAGAKIDFGKVSVRVEVSDHVIPDHFLTGHTEQDPALLGGLAFRLR